MPSKPTHAESARTVVSQLDRGALATLDRDSGHPFGSVVEYAPLDDGDVALLTSDLAEHTKNTDRDDRVSLLVAEGFGASSLLAESRVTLVGAFDRSVDGESLRSTYLDAHPGAENYVDFDDFQFARLRVERIRYIAGFGEMSWVELDAYRDAEPDPLADAAEGILEHMNDDHADAIVDIARAFGDAESPDDAEMTAVDRYGCEVRWTEDGDAESTRASYEEALDSSGEAREAMTRLTHRARERLESS